MIESANSGRRGVELLCDPKFMSTSEACTLARRCARLDSNLPSDLANRLVCSVRDSNFDLPTIQRVMNLLMVVSGRRYVRTICESLGEIPSRLIQAELVAAMKSGAHRS